MVYGIVKQNAGGICLLIIDLVMPEMTGRNLVKKLASFVPGVKYKLTRCLFLVWRRNAV